MSDKKILVMYTGSTFICPYVKIAQRLLSEHNIPYETVDIDRDDMARARVQNWTGFLSVPTLVVAAPGTVLPIIEPEPLEPASSPSGIDRGHMITEPSRKELQNWLVKHGFLSLIAN